MSMQFRFEWYDEDETVMHYIAEATWTWRDYHSCVRASLFSMHKHPHPVDSLIDLRGGTRDAMPSGLVAHMNSFGRVLTPALSGEAVVLGLPDAARERLPLDENQTLPTRDGRVYIAEDEAHARQILAQLKAQRESDRD
jgi:hypothetical protein